MGLKPADVAARLTAMGLDVTAATVKVWESNADRRPNPYNLEGLERLFDSKAPAETPPSSGLDTDAIVAAIDRLTAAVLSQQEASARAMDTLAAAVGAALGTTADTRSETPDESVAPPAAQPGGR